jgi:hypothetical protein
MHRPPPGRQSQCEGLTNEEEETFPMAELKPSAVPRPYPGVRGTATHSGVTHIREYQRDRYTIIGNHLAQHRELSALAIGLGTHILSLPEGASADIRTLADRFPESRDRIAFALRELETYGYLRRVRERTPGGRVVTRTYAFNAPALTYARTASSEEGESAPLPSNAPEGACGGWDPSDGWGVADPAPTGTAEDPAPAADFSPDEPVPADSTPADLGDSGSTRPVPSAPATSPRRPAVASRRDEQRDQAAALLARLRRVDDRLTLSRRDVDRLADAVVAWFDSGASPVAVLRTLTANLPSEVKSPAGLVAHRLHDMLPPLPARGAVPSGSGLEDTPPGRPDPFQTCPGCERAFRAPQPGRCRDCRSGPQGPQEAADSARAA